MPDQDPDSQQLSQTGQAGINLGAPSNSLRGFIQSMVNIHAQRKQAAAGDMDRMLLAANKGFPVDPKAMEKAAKRAGIPLMHPEDMQGLINPPKQGGQSGGQSGPVMGDQPANPKQGGKNEPPAEDPHAQAFNVKSISDVKKRQQAETGLAVDGIIRQAVTNAHLRGSTQEQILKNTQDMLSLKSQAMGGDPRAYGTLLKMGEIKPDVTAEAFHAFTPDQKQKFLGTLYGAESDAAKAQRVSAGTTHLMSEGFFSSPEDATKAAAILAEGGVLPPDLKAKMRPISLSDMVKEVGTMGDLAALGLPGDSIAQYARNVGLVGISNAFPTGFQTIQQQEITLKKKGLSIEQQNANTSSENAGTSRSEVRGFDKKGPDGKPVHVAGTLENQATEMQTRLLTATNTASRIQLVMKSQADKDFLASYTAMVDVVKSGGKVDPDVMALMQQKLVQKMGGQLTLEDADNFLKTITFGMFGGTHKVLKMGVDPSAAQNTFGDPSDQDNDGGGDPATSGAGSPQN